MIYLEPFDGGGALGALLLPSPIAAMGAGLGYFTAFVRFAANGEVDRLFDYYPDLDIHEEQLIGTWLTGGDPSLYEIRTQGHDGTAFVGEGSSEWNVWMSMAVDRLWGVQAGDGGASGTKPTARSIHFTIEIRRASDKVIVATSAVTVSAGEA